MRVFPRLAFCGFIALTALAQSRGGAGASAAGGRAGAGVSIGIRPSGAAPARLNGVRTGNGRVFIRGQAGNSRFRPAWGAGFGYGIGYPYFGYGLGIPFQPSFWDFSSYSIGYGSYGAGFAEPNLNVIYSVAPPAAATPEVVRARPIIREYNERGEEVTAQPAVLVRAGDRKRVCPGRHEDRVRAAAGGAATDRPVEIGRANSLAQRALAVVGDHISGRRDLYRSARERCRRPERGHDHDSERCTRGHAGKSDDEGMH
jgi:hypothetical protein